MWAFRFVKTIKTGIPLKICFIRHNSSIAERHWLLDNPQFQRYLTKTVEEYELMLKQLISNEGKDENSKEELQMIITQKQPIYQLLTAISNQRQLISQLKTLTEDEELKEMASEDLENSRSQLEQLIEKNLMNLMVPELKDIREIQLEITAGVGGSEAMLFSKDLLNMYINYCVWKGWKHEINTCQQSDLNGIRHVAIGIEGESAYHSLKFESGVHRVQRIPQTEKSGRVHTSTASVAVLPQPTQISVVVNDNDLKVETKRASGAGGQHVNKTESAIRMVHITSGLVVECQTSRSQVHNRAEAKRKLEMKLYQMQFEVQLSQQQATRKIQVGTSSRSEKIRTYNYMQDRITDHRLNLTLYNLKEFMNGEEQLNRMIQTLKRESQNEILIETIQKHLK